MELVVVERTYERPVTDEELARIRERAGPCFELRRVTHVETYLARDRRRAICLYEAPDAATVRDAHDQEGVPYTRIWSAEPPLGPKSG